MSPLFFRKLAISLAMFAVVSVGSAVAVKADNVTFNLTNGNPGISPPHTGPYATVSITTPSLNSNMATITITGLSQGGFNYLLGGQGIVGLNFNGAVAIDGSLPSGDLSLGGAANEDGFGLFNFTL